eukprot:295283-Rhodomonas_salina.1
MGCCVGIPMAALQSSQGLIPWYPGYPGYPGFPGYPGTRSGSARARTLHGGVLGARGTRPPGATAAR